jgi:hypothetical protein
MPLLHGVRLFPPLRSIYRDWVLHLKITTALSLSGINMIIRKHSIARKEIRYYVHDAAGKDCTSRNVISFYTE